MPAIEHCVRTTGMCQTHLYVSKPLLFLCVRRRKFQASLCAAGLAFTTLTLDTREELFLGFEVSLNTFGNITLYLVIKYIVKKKGINKKKGHGATYCCY